MPLLRCRFIVLSATFDATLTTPLGSLLFERGSADQLLLHRAYIIVRIHSLLMNVEFSRWLNRFHNRLGESWVSEARDTRSSFASNIPMLIILES
uniref:Putative secreted protein n=1 Tax=Amblyomma cajennense TaxID=34607 RepID=A0A023FDB3_AMBCJ